jgi:hypothetical protein
MANSMLLRHNISYGSELLMPAHFIRPSKVYTIEWNYIK